MPLTNSVQSTKNLLREQGKRFRKFLSAEEKAHLDTQILQNLLNSRVYQNSPILFTYLSLPGEIDTRKLIEQAWADGKSIALPRCVPGTADLEFFGVSSWNELESGPFHLLEPSPERCRPAVASCDTLCIVPGLSFDLEGYRVGYGKGYYDRFLRTFIGVSVGICYHECLSEFIPRDSYDQSVSILITDRMVRQISNH